MNRRWVVIALCLCACEGPFVPPRPPGPPPPPVAVVQVTPDSATIIAGDTLRLSATLRDSTGMTLTDRVVTWAPANNAHVYCWGDNTAGQVGAGTGTLIEALPRPAASATRFDRMTAGALHTCALATDGTAYCWGRNTENQLGRGMTPGNTTIPGLVFTTVKFDSITAGGSHSCALRDGTAYCWGLNSNGQIGDGGTTPRQAPVSVQAD